MSSGYCGGFICDRFWREGVGVEIQGGALLTCKQKKNERFWRKFFFVSFQNWARINRPRQTSCTDDCVA